MSNFASLARRCATGLVATQMLLGAVSVSTLALAAPVRAAEAAPFAFPQAPAAPQAPAPQAPAPQSPAPQAPGPQAQAPQSPAPQAPAPAPLAQAPAPQAPQAPAPISYLAKHGDWQGFSLVVDGQTVVGAMTHMNNGGVAAFMADKAGNLEILLADPSWKLQDGMTVPVRVTVDGLVYTFTATAHGNRLEMQGVTEAVLKSFVGGTQAQIDAGNGAVVWTLALDGFYDAAKDAARVIQA